MDSATLRKTFLDFFEKRRHVIVPSSSLIPDDPSVLLTTAGMQQFKKYYTGELDFKKDYPGKTGAASVQKSFRTSDIDEVGDESHLTFFEMLGNFSFGGYFKEEAIAYAKEFLEHLNLTIDYVTVFGGDERTPFDEASYAIWQKHGVKDIRKAGREDNFWGPTGSEGPCGPTTEIYINGVEIWNIVFNEYYCKPDGTMEPLQTPGVDTGMGLERLAMALQNKKNIFETDLFEPFIKLLPQEFGERTKELEERIKRIIIDHLRGSVFLVADGVRPSNKEAGYVLRRLMRRIFVYEKIHDIQKHVYASVIDGIIREYGDFYTELPKNSNEIRAEFEKEREKFVKTLERGTRELSSLKEPMTTKRAFHIYETYGIPFEIIKEFGGVFTLHLTREAFDEEFKKHQEISRAGIEKKFGGHGLMLDTGELKAANEEEVKIVTRLHTATHLLQAALRAVLGPEVEQRGSDITAERTRFDFSFSRKLIDEEKKQVENWVNDVIARDLPIERREMSYEEAMKSGALHFFREKYPQRVNVYSVVDEKSGKVISRELCGGPHVARTGAIGAFRIIKEESIAAGIRRIRATVG